MKDLILVASRFLLWQFLDMLWGNIGEHVLEKIGNISMARSSGTRP
jgi:hypothetical protein